MEEIVVDIGVVELLDIDVDVDRGEPPKEGCVGVVGDHRPQSKVRAGL